MAETPLARAGASIEIAVSPEAAFDAWLNPALAARFMGAGEMTVPKLEIDAREGGEFRIVMQRDDVRLVHVGRFVLVERPRRLVFTWISPGTDERLSLVTVSFTPTAAGVRVTVEHEGLPDAERAGRHDYGWGTILAKLASLIGASR
jgi:uncharacterized protein YndB with AHSA1/START domain